MTIPSAPGVSSRRGLHRVVVHHLGPRIVRGELGAGATLPTEADLSTELGVSRTVIREATREALIASTARETGCVISAADVDGRPATGRNT
jgi:DNA-binding FadR family transcriptional regulator